MTDNEIVKALECCANAYDCPDCPFEDDCGSMQKLSTFVVDLINSQKAEIERLNVAVKAKDVKLNTGDYALEKSVSALVNAIKTAKSEAIKEFAERLKTKMNDMSRVAFDDKTYFLISIEFIDNLLKEMDESNKLQQESNKNDFKE